MAYFHIFKPPQSEFSTTMDEIRKLEERQTVIVLREDWMGRGWNTAAGDRLFHGDAFCILKAGAGSMWA